MTAKDILLSKSTLSSGTAADVMKSIEGGLIYVGDTRYVSSGVMLSGTCSVMGDVDDEDISGNIDVIDLDGNIDAVDISADIVDSDKG